MALKDYARVLLERWKSVVAGIAVGILAAAVLTIFVGTRYSAHSDVYLSAPVTGDASEAYNGSLLAQQKAKEYVQLTSGSAMAQAVSARLGPGAQLDEVAAALSASAEPDSALITLTATSSAPEQAQALATAAGASLVDLVKTLERPTDAFGSIAPGPVVGARVVAPAELPGSPTSSGLLPNLFLGAVLGLIAGCGIAATRAAFDTSIRSVDDFEDALGAPCLSAVPGALRDGPRLIVDERPDSPRAEAFRMMRTRLEFLGFHSGGRTILVTSPAPGDGRTTAVCNLAIALAQDGRRVVVVDADLRRPAVGGVLDLPPDLPGLTSVLTHHADLDTVLHIWTGGAGNLHVLPAGTTPPNPVELLNSARAKELLEELASRFDVVLIDGPPLLAVADASLLASRADGVLVVCRRDRATQRQVLLARHSLDTASATVVGGVLTMVDGRRAPRGSTVDGRHVTTTPSVRSTRSTSRVRSTELESPSWLFRIATVPQPRTAANGPGSAAAIRTERDSGVDRPNISSSVVVSPPPVSPLHVAENAPVATVPPAHPGTH